MQIFKYKLPLGQDYASIVAPMFSKFISAQHQPGDEHNLYLWAMVDISNPETAYKFRIAGTGQVINEEPRHLEFINTVQMPVEEVWHVFRVRE